MPKPITLLEEIADLKRELKLRESTYPKWRASISCPRTLAQTKAQHDHQIACTRATLARLESLVPTQATLF